MLLKIIVIVMLALILASLFSALVFLFTFTSFGVVLVLGHRIRHREHLAGRARP